MNPLFLYIGLKILSKNIIINPKRDVVSILISIFIETGEKIREV